MDTSNLPKPSSGKCTFLANLFSLWRKARKTNKNLPPWMRLYRRFTIEELSTATNKFRTRIRKDAFFSVYKGFLFGCEAVVAIKGFKSDQRFWGEQEMGLLSDLHHPNIASLIGYCLDGSESIKFIVYGYLSHGTLYDQLHSRNDSKSLLSWKKRLEICIGAARGLECLHTNNPSIIHRNIKTSNILLGHNWVAKISDFELSRILSEADSQVSTGVAGTLGYMDPEYYRTGHCSKKTDVYSFGVVLFEVLSARRPYRRRVQGETRIQWCRVCVEDGRLDDIVDPRLKDEIAPDCLKAYADMAYKCTNERTDERPTIDAVVKRLQLTLLLQECIEADIPFSPSWLRSIVPPPKGTEPLVESEIQDSEIAESLVEFEIQDSEIPEPLVEFEIQDWEIPESDYDVEDLLRG